MAETQAAATPPANSGGIDYEKLGNLIATQVASAVTAAVKPVHEQLQKLSTPTLAPAPAKEKGAEENKPLTASDVTRIVTEAITGQRSADQNRQQREQYQGEKLKDLPAVYRNQLGNDPSKWASEEQAIRDQFKGDLKSLNVQPQNVGGAATTAGAKPGDAVDLSKLSPTAKIEMGIKNSKVQPQAAANTTTTGNAA